MALFPSLLELVCGGITYLGMLPEDSRAKEKDRLKGKLGGISNFTMNPSPKNINLGIKGKPFKY